jgi:hypothetical protein
MIVGLDFDIYNLLAKDKIIVDFDICNPLID